MSAKNFLIDPANDLQRSYADLLRDTQDEYEPGESPTYAAIVTLLKNICGKHEEERHLFGPLFFSPNKNISIRTSGTTGTPKQVVYTPEQLLRAVKVSDIHVQDVWGLTYPLDRFAGLQVLFQALVNQNTIVNLRGMPMAGVGAAIEKYEITHLSATPTFYRLLMAAGTGDKGSDPNCRNGPAGAAHNWGQTPYLPTPYFHNVQQVTCGGERLDSNTAESIRQCFPNARITNIYASTEAGSLLTSDGDQFEVPESLKGKFKVLDSRLMVHQSLLGGFDCELEDEFFFTGDLVSVCSDDPLSFTIEARDSDTIVVAGNNVNPHTVELCLVNLPEVADARVYGTRNSVTGNLVCCDVVLQAGCVQDHAAMRAALSESLQPYEIPRIINVVAEIERNESGKKIRKRTKNEK